MRLVCIFLYPFLFECTASFGGSGVVLLIYKDPGFALGWAGKSSCHIRASRRPPYGFGSGEVHSEFGIQNKAKVLIMMIAFNITLNR